MSAPPETLAPALERLIAERQAARLPSVAAAVVRKGEPVWSGAVGSASYEDDLAATADTQYRVGSITKTFTATAIMQLRDAGELDLDDRLEQHIDGVANGTPTIRRLLCHLSGLEREAGGHVRDRALADGAAARGLVAVGHLRAGAAARHTTTRTSRSRCSGRWSRASRAWRTPTTSTSASSARSG